MQPWRESGIVLSFKDCNQTLALRLACGAPPPRAGEGLGRTHPQRQPEPAPPWQLCASGVRGMSFFFSH